MPRSTAAAFTGSTFAPASGGQTTAAIASPSASSRFRTSAANAAWPTRRIRTRPSALQVRREEGLQALPGVARGLGTVGVALVAEEAVRRLRVDDHLGLLPVALELRLQLVDVVEGDERIVLAEECEEGRLHLVRLRGVDAAAVERRRRGDLVGELRGDLVRDAAALAEAGDP